MASDATRELIRVLRSFRDDSHAFATHFQDCWKVHPYCAMGVAADALEELPED